jgi:hypothetical protein
MDERRNLLRMQTERGRAAKKGNGGGGAKGGEKPTITLHR